MKHLALIAALSAVALPAVAQDWTSYRSGNQTNHTGYDQNGGMWTGTTRPRGDGRTSSTFYGPNGQMTDCTSTQSGSRVNTTCY
jgi:hypothetical protein